MTFVNIELFKKAVFDGDLKTVKHLLSSGANPNIECDEYGSSLLHLVNSPEIAQELITFGADIEAKDSFGRTPLCCAVTNSNRLKVAEVLLSNGANVNARMGLDTTPLHVAPNFEVTNLLLSRGADVNIVDSFGRAPIHSALIDRKGLKVLKALLTAGANANIRIGKYQNSLLHYADSLQYTRELLLHGADIDAERIDGGTPLHWAVKHLKEIAVVQELLKWGAHVDADFLGDTALAIAIRFSRKNVYVIKELLKYNASIYSEMVNHSLIAHCSILESAVHEDLPCAKLLVKMYLLKGWDKDLDTQITFDTMLGELYSNGKELLRYKGDCVSEIIQMKSDKMFIKYTLFNLFSRKEDCVKPIFGSYRAIEKELESKYPIYHCEIMEEVKKGLERGRLLTRLEQFYTILKSCKDIEIEIKLNSDCLLMIASHLSDSDILNIIITFENYIYHPLHLTA